MLTEFLPSYHASEDIHEHCDIDKMSLKADVDYIANPDLIASTDVKRLQWMPHGRIPSMK
ncbi:hypothetical protein C6500_17450 [Candidatus Poribacteria bacterium]|nr:MAG: hypothetical protein C6500_17450 [Candidatus Poribacteria bacterium]